MLYQEFSNEFLWKLFRYAYVHFNKQDDAKKMVSELQGGLYFGNIINATLEYRDIETDKSTG